MPAVTTTTGARLRLLVAEDSSDDFELLLRELRRGGFVVTAECVCSEPQLHAALDRPWDLVISDWLMPGFSGKAVLGALAARKLAIPCIVVSGTPSEEAAVEALRSGALDFLSKDKPRRLVPAIERALREAAEHAARVAAERELKLSEERYRTGFDVAPDALLTYDLEANQIVDANSKAQALFRRSLAELRASPLGALSTPIQPDGRTAVEAGRDYIARGLAGESLVRPWTFLVEGEEIPGEIRMTRLPTTTGRLVRVTITDLRERLRTEEIRRRSAELEIQNRRIQEANRLKSEFLANMSHELRTPLNAIIGFAELLHDGAVPVGTPQHQEFLGDILTSGRHLLRLINDVLDLAKVEAGKIVFHPEPVKLTGLLREVVAIVRTTAAQRQLVVDVACEDLELVLDPGRLKQITYNYLSNALKFTPSGGRVIVRACGETPTTWRLEVEDTGMGIAPDDLGRLFVEFQQLEAGTSKRFGGTGLGLALTRRLVEAQGGSVGVRSTVGTGTTFHAVLPRRFESTEPVMVSRTITRKNARTVLVVEDDRHDQSALVATLAGAGYSVETATTGKEALAHMRKRKFDALTVDLLLPDMSGLDLLSAVRQEHLHINIPVIVVTVVPDANVLAGFRVHDVLHKPLDRDSLLSSLVRAGVHGVRRKEA